MKIKKIICAAAAAAVAMSSAAFAMPTAQFDNGMRRGINYYDRGMYYEARDEFQWFCDANWGKMNSGQRQYALDYLDGTKAKINSHINKVVGRYTHTTEPNLHILDITYYDGKTISFSIYSVNSRGTRMASYSSTEPINNGVCYFYYMDSRCSEGKGTLEIKGNTIVLSLDTYYHYDGYSIEYASGTYVRSGDL